MTMKAAGEKSPRALSAALAEAERVLAMPVIPGELESWARRARTQLRGLAASWMAEEDQREEQLGAILEDDLELAGRARYLRDRQRDLTRELEELRAAADELITPLTGGGWQPIARAEECRDRALVWIVRARSFGPELEAWRREALYRDRGPKD